MKPSSCLAAAVAAFGLLAAAAPSHAADWSTWCASASYVCAIVEIDSSDQVSVTPEPIDLSKHSRKTYLVWELPEGFVFDRSQGDGVFMKDQNGEFDAETVVGDDGLPTSRPRKRFKMRVHKPLKDSHGYEYALVFHALRSGNPFKRYQCDPTIVNSSALTLSSGSAKPGLTSHPLKCVIQ